MLVDTGATISLISSSYLATLPKEGLTVHKGTRSSLRTVAGDTVPVDGVATISLSIAGENFRRDIYVANIVDQCILGFDFMKEHECVLNARDGTLLIGQRQLVLGSCGASEVQCSRHVICRRTVTVEPYAEVVIPGWTPFTRQSKVLLVEPCPEGPPTSGIMVARGLIRHEGQAVPVRLLNLTPSPIVLQKGQQLAQCDEVVEIRATAGADSTTTHFGVPAIDPNLLQYIENLIACTEPELLPDQKEKIRSLFLDFNDVFSFTSADLGRTTAALHHIDTGTAKPIKQSPRRLPLSSVKEVDQLIHDMQSQDVIEPSSSPWASPIVLVKKKDGSTRFCVDYRRLNEVTKKDSYPLPRIDDTLHALAGAALFSTLDLRSGYWQVGVAPQHKEKTAFTTGRGLWQFKVMPFGLCNAPATFQRLMENVLSGLPPEVCLVYIDDVIVHSKTFDEHVERLKRVFERLRTANLKLNPTKCKFLKPSVVYLGHLVSATGVQADSAKVESIQSWPVPTDKPSLRAFLGFCSYYRRFVPHFAELADPLYQILTKQRSFQWTSSCNEAFVALKACLTSPPVLAFPLPDAPFILDTDASQTGIGAVLSQLQDGEERIIACFSRALRKPERNYCVTRQELLAVVKSVQHFHHYLYGRHFSLRTDHAALQWLLTFRNPEGQVARWIQTLQEYDFTPKHRRGRDHANADALSRIPCAGTNCRHCSRDTSSTHEACAITVDSNANLEHLRLAQVEDPNIGPILAWKQADSRPPWAELSSESEQIKGYWALWGSLELHEGLLYRIWESADGRTTQRQLILPTVCRDDALRMLHSSPAGGHYGVNKTLAKVRERYYWLEYKRDVEEWCRSCDLCASRKGPRTRTRGKLQECISGTPFERVALDILGPLPTTNHGNKYLLVVMDYFTKWPEAYPLPNQEATTVAEALVNQWVSRFGAPMLLHSDQGRNFESRVFQDMCRCLGISKTRTTAQHPQSDGMVERFNRTILQHLSLFVSDNQRNWDELVPLFLLSYRTALHETIGETPATMVTGRNLRLPTDLALGPTPDGEHAEGSVSSYLVALHARLEAVHRFARRHMKQAFTRMKTRYDRRATDGGFAEGQSVWLFNPARKRGLSPKLQRHWQGPYVITKRLNDVVYRIRRTGRSRPLVVHIDRLALYHGSQASGEEEGRV